MPLSKVKTNSISDNAIGSTQIADNAVTIDQLDSPLSTGRKNILINSTFKVNQYDTISTTATSITSNQIVVDRWYLRKQNTGNHNVTLLENQTVTGLTGVHNVLKIEGFHDSSWLGQNIEVASNTHLSGAEVTVSFYAKADATINNCRVFLHLGGSDGGNHGAPYFTQTQEITTSWQRYSFTMTCGTLANDNANSRLNCGIGQTDTDTTFYVTGVQLEIGSKATPLESRNIQEELNDCYRFFYNFKSSESSGEVDNVFSNVFFWSGSFQGYVKFPVEMRKIPSMTRSDLSTFNLHQAGVFTRTPSSLNVGDAGTQGSRVTGGMTYTGTNGLGGQLTADNTDTAFMKFNAEF